MDSMPVVFACACGASAWCVCGVRARFGSRASHPEEGAHLTSVRSHTHLLFPNCWDYCWDGCFGVVDNQMLPPHLYVTFQ